MKSFIHEDLTKKYSNTEFKKIPGKSPELVFFNGDAEVERVDIADLKRSELNDLMKAKGFTAKASEHDEV